jgi:hypothetical protein
MTDKTINPEIKAYWEELGYQLKYDDRYTALGCQFWDILKNNRWLCIAEFSQSRDTIEYFFPGNLSGKHYTEKEFLRMIKLKAFL